MAVEKLILRSIYYGVDKIPDKWFHAIPGGYYRAKNGEIKKDRSKSTGVNREERSRNGSRAAREEDFHGEDDRSRRGRRSRRRRDSYDDYYDDDEDVDDHYYHRHDRDNRRGRSKSRGLHLSRDCDRYIGDHSSRGRPRYDDARFDRDHRPHSGPGHANSSWAESRNSYQSPLTAPIQPPPLGQYRARQPMSSNANMPDANAYHNRGNPLPRSQTFAEMPTGNASHGTSSHGASSQGTSTQATVGENPGPHSSSPRVNHQQSFQHRTSAAASKDGAMSDNQLRSSRQSRPNQFDYGNREIPLRSHHTRRQDTGANSHRDANYYSDLRGDGSHLGYGRQGPGSRFESQAEDKQKYTDLRETLRDQVPSSPPNRYYYVRREPETYRDGPNQPWRQ